jgi:cell division protein WhiA
MSPSSDLGFTEAVRQELARLPLGTDAAVRAELSAIVRFAGTLAVHGGDPPTTTIEVASSSGAVARRTYALVQRRYGDRPELLVRAPGGVRRRSTYGVRLTVDARHVVRDLEVVDADGRPAEQLPPFPDRGAAVAFVRGALLASGSISSPGRPAHLEIVASSPGSAGELARLVTTLLDGSATASGDERPRMVVKSGATIGELLALVGATGAFLTLDERRLRRELRSDANRLANADAANLKRTIEAAAAQVRAVEAAIEAVGWDALDDDLRVVALARLANPAASLAELGELADPPIGKAAVHRRLRRLERLAPDGSTPSA